MTLVDWTILSLIFSIVGNLCCLWYIRKLLGKLLFISQNLGESLLLLLEEYEDVYEITDPIEFIETEQDEQEYDTEKTGEKTFRETDVFYGGSRGSNS